MKAAGGNATQPFKAIGVNGDRMGKLMKLIVKGERFYRCFHCRRNSGVIVHFRNRDLS
jgi:hypothetical protein